MLQGFAMACAAAAAESSISRIEHLIKAGDTDEAYRVMRDQCYGAIEDYVTETTKRDQQNEQSSKPER